MKKKILVIVICTLLITTIASFSATAKKCERKPTTHIIWQNSPPDAPTVKIPEIVRTGSLFYIKLMTTDPNNDDVYYKYDLFGIDPVWEGPYQSGEEYLVTIIIGLPAGDYTLSAQAKDCHGAESDWTYMDFTVVKTKTVTSPFLNFLENHPNLFPILRQLLGL